MSKRNVRQFVALLAVGPLALIGTAQLFPSAAAGEGVGVLDPTSVTQSDAAAIYAKNCAACHGSEGKGDGPAAAAMDPHPPDLTDAEKMGALSDEDLLSVISDGKGSMPGYSAMLEAAELEALAEYVRSMSEGEEGGR